ncbi:MAG TPA: phage tail protein [Polaromonas sp.]|nr:phage tail protein [Polaromonas sp.]
MNFDIGPLRAASDKLRGFSPSARAAALNTALKTVAKRGATVARKESSAEYNLKQATIGARMSVSVDRPNLRATIKARSSKSNRIPLKAFGATKFKVRNKEKGGAKYLTGVKVRIRRKGEEVKLRHAFIATMPNGYVGVFQREDAGTKRLKIKEVTGLDVPQMFVGRRVKPAVIAKMLEVAPGLVLHEMVRKLQSLGFK